MVKFSKSDWIAHLLDNANEVPLCFACSNNNKGFALDSDVLPYFHSCLQVFCNSNKKYSITCVFHISFSCTMIKKGIIQSIILNWKPSTKFRFTHSFLFILFMLIFLCIYLIDQLEITKIVTEFSIPYFKVTK